MDVITPLTLHEFTSMSQAACKTLKWYVFKKSFLLFYSLVKAELTHVKFPRRLTYIFQQKCICLKNFDPFCTVVSRLVKVSIPGAIIPSKDTWYNLCAVFGTTISCHFIFLCARFVCVSVWLMLGISFMYETVAVCQMFRIRLIPFLFCLVVCIRS